MNLKMNSVWIATILSCNMAFSAIYTDSTGDIDPTISTGGGTLDILGMEVSNTLTDITFTLSLNGNVATVDWGKFLIGIATGGSEATTTGNGWNRPINMNSPTGGMTHWIGSWVDVGGGSQLWDYDGAAWGGPAALTGFTITGGTTSTITYTLSLSSLGLSVGNTFYFDAYSTGGGGTDAAIDALANPNVSVTSWNQTYTSDSTAGIYSYTVVPEPTTIGLMGLGIFGIARALRRKK